MADDDVSFRDMLERAATQDDSELADMIETDGRFRLDANRPVPLERYLDAVDDLVDRPEPLDAAIDMALRGLRAGGLTERDAVDRLTETYPALARPIRESAALNNALWSTMHLRRHLDRSPPRRLPCDFGPKDQQGVHRYELRELIGEGAFGEVYVALDRQLSEPEHDALVSIKILPGSDRSESSRRLLIDEATKARRISHPNVVSVLDRGVSGQNEDFIVYEFVDGGDLSRWARYRRPTPNLREVAELVAKIARGVQAAHMAGLVHCDLKPGNIVLTSEGEPKVVDFGVAVRESEFQRIDVVATDESGPMGNLAFMSPEQFRRDEGALTIPSDIYALGGILFWLLTDQLPNGDCPDDVARVHDPIRGRAEPPSPREIRADIDRDLDAVCRRAMAPAPEDRYSSAAALADDLQARLEHRPLPWNHPGVPRRVQLWVRRRPSLAAATALIMLLAMVGAIVIRHYVAVANKRRLEAAVATARAEEIENQRNQHRQDLIDFGVELKQALDQDLYFVVLTDTWVIEWLYGPTTLGEGPGKFRVWTHRVDAIRGLLRDAEASGQGTSLETNFWRTALAFWRLKEGDWREAGPLLDSANATWSTMLQDDDPWLDGVRALQVCVRVNKLFDTGGQPVDRDAARLILADLERAESSLADRAPNIQVRLFVLEQMRKLVGPDVLDDPVRFKELGSKTATIRSMAD